MPLDPGYKGGTIVAEVLDTSDSLRELLAQATVNHKGHFILNVFPSHGILIRISNALCAGRQIGKTSASAVMVLPHKT